MRDYNGVLEIQDIDENMYATVLEVGAHRILTITDGRTSFGLIQGRMLMGSPLILSSKYMPLALVGLQWFRQVNKITFLGLGVGAMPRYLRAAWPYAEITIVERYQQVIELSNTHFFGGKLLDSFKVVREDYLPYLNSWNPIQDILIVDVFTGKTKIDEMTEPRFYEMCRMHTRDKGVVTVNLVSDSRLCLTRCFDSAAKIFPYVYELGDGLPDQQRILAASMSAPPKHTLLERQRYSL